MADKDGEFRRVQVKYRALDRFGKVDAKFSTCWNDKHGTHSSPIDKDECYYLRPRDFCLNVSLRVETPKNGQSKGIIFAADFRRAP